MSAVGGQIFWSVQGSEKRALIGRAEVVDLEHGIVVTSACPLCCPDSWQSVSITPPSFSGVPQDNVQFVIWQQNVSCTGTQRLPFIVDGVIWQSSNTSVASIDGTGFATAVGPGSATISGQWQVDSWSVDFSNCEYINGHIDPHCRGECSDTQSVLTLNAGCMIVSVAISGAQSVQDGSNVDPTFTLTPQGGSPDSYQWSWSAPAGAGNNPLVTFSPSNAATTVTNRHWFANPNVACPSPPAVHIPPVGSDPYYNSVYTITGQANFGGLTPHKDSTLTVNNYWSPAGHTYPPAISGGPTIGKDNSRNLWVVVDAGTLMRNTPVVTIFVPLNSQFYNKTVIHENRHVQQYVSGLASDLFTVPGLMAQLSPLTDPTQAGLSAQIAQAYTDWLAGQNVQVQMRENQLEQDAHSVSDPVAPQYAYQLCQ
jgi:hypothetical protein